MPQSCMVINHLPPLLKGGTATPHHSQSFDCMHRILFDISNSNLKKYFVFEADYYLFNLSKVLHSDW